jgi:hypothetical protein
MYKKRLQRCRMTPRYSRAQVKLFGTNDDIVYNMTVRLIIKASESGMQLYRKFEEARNPKTSRPTCWRHARNTASPHDADWGRSALSHASSCLKLRSKRRQLLEIHLVGTMPNLVWIGILWLRPDAVL